MVDPLDPEQVERLPHVRGGALLPRVGHQPQPLGAGPGVDLGEQRRRIPDLGRVQPDPQQGRPARDQRVEHRHRLLDRPVAQEARDEPRRHSGRGRGEGARDPLQHRLDRDATGEVGLRVDEQLDVAHPGRRGPRQVRLRHRREVRRLPEHRHVRVVEVEEVLEVVEGVAGAQVLEVAVGQGHPVPLGQLHDQLGLERALDVDVQLDGGRGVGHAGDPGSRATGSMQALPRRAGSQPTR
ncbi:hypothetical protein GCM10023201_55750 [Actinomycetospora corticicola]